MDYGLNDVKQSIEHAVDLWQNKPRMTRGHSNHPKALSSDENKGQKLHFSDACKADNNRLEYPILKGKVYDGGPRNRKYGNERVVFYYIPGTVGPDGKPVVTYCGLITHTGAGALGGFKNC